ncbi:hypothetical protein [Pseudomonas sp. YL-218 TE3947]|jgi:hypothetical protein|uniref:hypothetical protein n=1 Tax=Pseudomonas TaxID=286 RepID=UPI003D1F72B1
MKIKTKIITALLITMPCIFYYKKNEIIFSITPSVFSNCEQSGSKLTASWNVTKKDVTNVSVFVNSIGERESLWTSGGPAGAAETGNWVGDGLTFTLKDQNNKTLAKRTVETTRCLTNAFGQ